MPGLLFRVILRANVVRARGGGFKMIIFELLGIGIVGLVALFGLRKDEA